MPRTVGCVTVRATEIRLITTLKHRFEEKSETQRRNGARKKYMLGMRLKNCSENNMHLSFLIYLRNMKMEWRSFNWVAMVIYSVAPYDFINFCLVWNWISQRDQTIHGNLFAIYFTCTMLFGAHHSHRVLSLPNLPESLDKHSFHS
jgi:hypothetical protein